MDQRQKLRKVVKDKATRTQLQRTRILKSLKSLKKNGLRMIMKQQAFLCALRKVNLKTCRPVKVYSWTDSGEQNLIDGVNSVAG